MKKELKILAFLFAGFLAFLWLERPLRRLLNALGTSELEARLLAGGSVRFTLLIILVGLIHKLEFKKFNGLEKGMKLKNLQALIIPSAFILIGFLSNLEAYKNAGSFVLFLFAASVFLVGFVEEFFFRGIILPLFINVYQNKKNVLYISVVLSSLIFGAVHFINLFRQPDNFWGIFSQVLFATSIGIFFGGLMLRTGNVMVPALLHALVNFSFGAGDLKNKTLERITENAAENESWSSIIPTALFFIFILMGGLFMLGKVKREEVLVRFRPGKAGGDANL